MAFTMKSIVCLLILCSITHSLPIQLFPSLPTLRPLPGLFQFGATTLAVDPTEEAETTSSTTEMTAATQKPGFPFPMPDPGVQIPGLNIPGIPGLNIPGLNIPGLNGQIPFPLLPFPFPLPYLFDLNNLNGLNGNLRMPDQSSSLERSVSDFEGEDDEEDGSKFSTPSENAFNLAAEEKA